MRKKPIAVQEISRLQRAIGVNRPYLRILGILREFTVDEANDLQEY